MIRSAIAGNESLADSVTRQTIFFGISVIVILVVSLIDYRYWSTLARPLYFFVLAFLIFVRLAGATLFGATRWIETGLILIQPAELAKIAMILVLADFFARHQNDSHDLRWVGKSLTWTLIMTALIYLQPNLSTTIVVLVIWFSLLWISGLKLKYLLLFVVLIILVAVLIFPRLETYQQFRVISFLFPDPNARHGNEYNVDQALVTIGSGGLFGQGYGHSSQVQLRFLQVRHTDYIFSAVAGEFGFVGAVLVIGMLVFIIIRCIRAARLANDFFGTLISYGFATLIFFQAAVNVGVNLNVIPVTGLTLPFISYGGSSLVSLALGIGLVESVVSRHKAVPVGG